MPKRQQRRKPSSTPQRPQRRARLAPPPPPEPDPLAEVRAALAADDPLHLLGLASTLVEAFDPQRRGPLTMAGEPGAPTLEQLVQTFVDVTLPETSAVLAAVAELSGDDVLRRRLRREVASRGHALPRWLTELGAATPVEQVVEMTHVLGDGDDIGFGVRLPGGHELSVLVYVDHNMGTLVKDAFVVPGELSGIVEQMSAAAADPDIAVTRIDPADGRARVTDAIESWAMTVPPVETDSWPACRPLVEWVARLLPSGGTGYQRPEWSADALADLTERFFASRFAAGLDDADHRSLFESLLWFGTDHGPGDPLRWSPPAVEVLLLDWLPRKIIADVRHLAPAPELLRALIRFSHAARGIRRSLTDETLGAVDRFEPEYQAVIRSPRPQGPAALLAALGGLGPDGPRPSLENELAKLTDKVTDRLRAAVGGDRALTDLDAAPLPDEPFAWQLVPDDVHDRVAEVLALVDRCCEQLLDVEHRTACRRLLARAAAGDPEVFRRRGRADTAAAAIVWIVGRANHVFSDGTLSVKDLMAWFGLGQGTPSQRAQVFLRAVGAEPEPYGLGLDLGSTNYLTSARRARIIADRDRYRAMASDLR